MRRRKQRVFKWTEETDGLSGGRRKVGGDRAVRDKQEELGREEMGWRFPQ